MNHYRRKKNPPAYTKLNCYAFLLVLLIAIITLLILIPMQVKPAPVVCFYTLHTLPVPHQPKNKLPLKITAFSGKPDKDIIRLQWQTLSEKNINHFELQYSTNGVHFKTINKQIAKGIKNNPELYIAEDFKPAIGINFYLLKIVTNNDKIIYSQIITVNYKRI